MLAQYDKCRNRMSLTDDAPQAHGSTEGGVRHGGNSDASHHNAGHFFHMRKVHSHVLRYTIPRRQETMRTPDKITANRASTSKTVLT